MIRQVIISYFLTVCLLALVQGETVQDCENKLPPSLKSRLCEIRRYEIIEGPEMDKHIHCVMRALDFVYEDGRGDYDKLYDPLNIIELDKRHDVNLEKCIGECVQVPTSERAHVFYKCLLKSTTGRTFKKVFDLMELKQAGKVPQHQRYTAEFVQIMKDYDKALNC